MQGLGGTRDLDSALTRYEKQRNRDTKPAFEWTVDLARLRGASEIEERLFMTIGQDETEAANFFGTLSGGSEGANRRVGVEQRNVGRQGRSPAREGRRVGQGRDGDLGSQ